MIRTSILSYGMSGKVFHAPFISAHPAFQLHTICERSKSTSIEDYPHIHMVRTVEEAIHNDEIDLVVVNTPSVTHFEYAKMALEAGKHIIVEKPFTTTSSEAKALIKIAASRNKIIAVYHNRRNDSEIITLKKVLDSGKLGKLIEVEIHFDRFAPGVSYKAHKEKDVLGVGVIYDLGSHLIDSALYMFGMPQAVYADAWRTREVTDVDDMFEIILYYPSLKVTLKATSFALQTVPSFVAHGQNGSFLCARNNIQEERLLIGVKPGTAAYLAGTSDTASLTYLEDGNIVKEEIPLETGDYMNFFDGVASAIENGAADYVSGEAGSNVITIIEKAYESIHSGRKINL